MGIDKRKSIKGKWRINEEILIGLSILGGSLGMIISMYLFHHKTKKLKFKMIKFIFIIQVFIIIRYFL